MTIHSCFLCLGAATANILRAELQIPVECLLMANIRIGREMINIRKTGTDIINTIDLVFNNEPRAA